MTDDPHAARRARLTRLLFESALRETLGSATVFTHLEPLEDPTSFAETGLDRSASPPSIATDPAA